MNYFIAILLCFSTCAASAQEWSAADKQKMKDDCMADATKSLIPGAASDYCSCYVERFLERFPVKTTAVPDSALSAIAGRCMDEVKNRYPGGPFLDRWNESAKSSFVSGCKSKLKGVKINADAYCSCVLQKVMQEQPDPRLVKSIDPLVMDKITLECLGKTN